MAISNMLFDLLLLAFLDTAAAQSSTTTPEKASPASAPSSTSTWPTADIFFPGSFPNGVDHLGASVITADLNRTEYAIDCMTSTANNATFPCGLEAPITVTGGDSTLIYTFDPAHTGAPLPTPSSVSTSAVCCPTVAGGAVINCLLLGSSHSHASRAVCTGSSSISGLGLVGSTTTLASTQLQYATLTVTAGLDALDLASESAAQASGGILGEEWSTSSSAAAEPGARVTAGVMMGAGLVGALGAAL